MILLDVLSLYEYQRYLSLDNPCPPAIPFLQTLLHLLFLESDLGFFSDRGFRVSRVCPFNRVLGSVKLPRLMKQGKVFVFK